ncbi:MAG TPA: CHAD domain-containing protein [Pseudonocardiaceae bacterium]|nr:CHAD domain-containing protein [Pseudonocardiaceae bacterium]
MTSTVTSTVDQYLHDQISALRTAEDAIGRDDPEGVHDMRVSVRRLRDCLRTFRASFDPNLVRLLTPELSWLADVLGRARDVEVLRRRITAQLEEVPDELILGPVWSEFDRYLARPEADTMAAVRDALAGDRYRQLLSTLDLVVADRPKKKQLRRAIRKRARKVKSAVGQVSSAPDHGLALHNVRKKAKRLRYACEVAEPVLGKPARKVRKRSKQIQRTLGDHHDSVQVRAALRELGARAQVDGVNGFTFGLLQGRLGEHARGLEDDFAGEWRRLAGSTALR